MLTFLLLLLGQGSSSTVTPQTISIFGTMDVVELDFTLTVLSE